MSETAITPGESVLSDIPVLGRSVFNLHLVVLALGLVVAVWWAFRATPVGLTLKAAWDKPAGLDAAGVGGAYLSIVSAGTFEPFMTNGAGFIAIVIAMLARGRPSGVVIGAFLFGMSLALATALQLVGLNIPIDLVLMLPFIAVMVTLVFFARRAHLPAALGLAYVRGAR